LPLPRLARLFFIENQPYDSTTCLHTLVLAFAKSSLATTPKKKPVEENNPSTGFNSSQDQLIHNRLNQ
jgi:hypothetical protein